MFMEKKKLLVVCTTDSMIWNFLQEHILYWEEKGINVECACSKTGFYFDELQRKGFDLTEISFERSPFKIKNIKAYKQLNQLVERRKYDLIVCQEPVGGAISRLVAKRNDVPCIYTAHGFHFFKGAPLINWLIFYPIENLLSRNTKTLIVLNNEDYKIAKKMHANHVEKLNGIGINTTKINSSKVDIDKKKKELNLPLDKKIYLNVAELIKRKNHETAIRAFYKADLEDSIYIICGDGQLEENLKSLVRELKIEDKIIFLGFRKDVAEIYKISDFFLFPSYQEGLSISLLDAIAAGIPVIVSNIRGNVDIVSPKINGLIYDANDVNGFAEGLRLIRKMDDRKIMDFNMKLIEKYDIDVVKKHFFKIIADVLKRGEN